MCPNCDNSSPLVFNVQSFVNSQCADCIQQNCAPVKYLCYTGPDLACSGIVSGDTLEDALQKLDTQVCSAIGDYSTYQFNCLPTWWGNAITTESEFVDAITSYACDLADQLTTITSTTIPALETSVQDQVDAISTPAITCTTASVTSADDLNTILAKYCTKLGQLTTAISLSGVVWNNCIATSTPSTIAAAFQAVLDQICAVKTVADDAAVLPTFNNTSNCLSGTSNDSLESTVLGIIDLLCTAGQFDVALVSWGCVDSDDASNLQEAFHAVVDQLNNIIPQQITAVSADFVLTATDGDDPCAGLTLNLASPIVNSDRLVASNNADLSPGTLINKLDAGTNITLDDVTTPGKVIINADYDHLVLAGPGDDTPELLIDKLNGSNDNGVDLNPSYNAGTKQVDLTLTVDLNTLAGNMMSYIAASPTLLAQFCAMVATCGTGCDSTLYSVNNTSGSDQYIFWLTCGSSSYLNILVPTATTIEICAITDSIIPVTGVTVTDIGACPTLSPSTTTTTTTTTTTAAP